MKSKQTIAHKKWEGYIVATELKQKAFTINGKSAIHYIIVALFCVGFRYVPGFAGITPMGMGILGCFIGAIYGWSTIDMIWPSIMAMIGMGFIVGMNAMAQATFGNFIIVCMFFAFPALGILTSTGAMDFLVNKALTNKLTLGKPWLTVMVMLMACMFLATLNSIIICVIFCSFFKTILEQVGVEKYSKLATFLYLGIATACSLGQVMVPFMGQALSLVGAYAAMFKETLNFAYYFLISIPMSIIMIIVYVGLMRFVFRVDVSPLKNMTAEMLGESQKCTKDQKKALTFFVAWMAVILFSCLKFFGPVYRFFAMFGIAGIAMLLVVVVMLVKKEDGSPLLDFRAEAQHMSWDALLLTAFVLLMSTYMSLPEAGISAALAKVLQPFTSLPPLLFIVLALTFTAIVTNFANNMVMAIIVMPFLHNYAIMIGMDPTGVIVLLFMMAQFAIATPGASAMAGICFANPDVVKSKDMMKYGLMIVPLLIVFGLICGLTLQAIIF